MHGSTIGERLGAPKHGYIPLDKRDDTKREHDGDGRRSAILDYVREHDGEMIKAADIRATGAVNNNAEASRYLRQLEQRGKITRIKYKAGYKISLGKLPKTRENGEVEVTKPAAPFSRTDLSKLEAEAWAYIKARKLADATDLGNEVKGILGLVSHLESKLEVI